MGPVVPVLFSAQIAGACLSAGAHSFAITGFDTLSYLLGTGRARTRRRKRRDARVIERTCWLGETGLRG